MNANAKTIEAKTAVKTTALAFFDEVYETLSDLYGRWQDEKEYEDIEDYRAPFVEVAKKHGVRIVKMTKRPFGFVFSTELGTYTATANASGVAYKRIA
jgi:hypothetical protein